MRFLSKILLIPLALAASTMPAASLSAEPPLAVTSLTDELRPFLKKNFSKDKRIFRSVSNIVVSYDYAIQSTTQAESSRAHSMRIRSEECLLSLAAHLPPYLSAMQELDKLITASLERTAAYEAHMQRLKDMNFAVRNAPEWEDWCMQPVDKQAGEG